MTMAAPHIPPFLEVTAAGDDMEISSPFTRLDDDIDIDIDLTADPDMDYMLEDGRSDAGQNVQQPEQESNKDDLMIDDPFADVQSDVMRDDVSVDEHLTDVDDGNLEKSQVNDVQEETQQFTAAEAIYEEHGTHHQEDASGQGEGYIGNNHNAPDLTVENPSDAQHLATDPIIVGGHDGSDNVVATALASDTVEPVSGTESLLPAHYQDDDFSERRNGPSETLDQASHLQGGSPENAPGTTAEYDSFDQVEPANDPEGKAYESQPDHQEVFTGDFSHEENNEQLAQEPAEESGSLALFPQEEQSATHNGFPYHGGDGEEPQEHGSSSNSHPADESLSNYHPVVIVYEGEEISLFHDASLTFFLRDRSLYHRDISDLFEGFREVLGDSMHEEEELEIGIEELELYISEDSKHTTTASLAAIVDVYVELQHLDGVEDPDPLYVTLTRRIAFSPRLRSLRNDIAAGKGMSQITFPPAYAEFQEHSPEQDDEGQLSLEGTGMPGEQELTAAGQPDEATATNVLDENGQSENAGIPEATRSLFTGETESARIQETTMSLFARETEDGSTHPATGNGGPVDNHDEVDKASPEGDVADVPSGSTQLPEDHGISEAYDEAKSKPVAEEPATDLQEDDLIDYEDDEDDEQISSRSSTLQAENVAPPKDGDLEKSTQDRSHTSAHLNQGAIDTAPPVDPTGGDEIGGSFDTPALREYAASSVTFDENVHPTTNHEEFDFDVSSTTVGPSTTVRPSTGLRGGDVLEQDFAVGAEEFTEGDDEDTQDWTDPQADESFAHFEQTDGQDNIFADSTFDGNENWEEYVEEGDKAADDHAATSKEQTSNNEEDYETINFDDDEDEALPNPEFTASFPASGASDPPGVYPSPNGKRSWSEHNEGQGDQYSEEDAKRIRSH